MSTTTPAFEEREGNVLVGFQTGKTAPKLRADLNAKTWATETNEHKYLQSFEVKNEDTDYLTPLIHRHGAISPRWLEARAKEARTARRGNDTSAEHRKVKVGW
jgi:hypothetical protein